MSDSSTDSDRTRPAPVTASPPPSPSAGVRPERDGQSLFHRVGLPVLGVAGTFALWWFATWYFDIRTFMLPAPAEVGSALARHWDHLLENLWITIMEVFAGFGIGATAGLLMATLLVSSSRLERATLPLVIGFNAIPAVALAPLLQLWLGLYHAPKIAMAAIICFFPIMIAAMAGLKSTPAEMADLARSLSASRWQTFVKVKVPWALPQVFTGLKLGITLSVIGAVVAQIFRPSGGLGTVILLASTEMNTPLAFGAILLLMLMSVSLFYGVAGLERLLLPWARVTTTART